MTGISGGYSKRPRWYGEVIRTLDSTTLRVLDVLDSADDLPGAPGVVSIGVRELSRRAGRSIGAVRRGLAELEARGLIVRDANGAYGRHRWRMVKDTMPLTALMKRPTLRAKHPRDPQNGRFR